MIEFGDGKNSSVCDRLIHYKLNFPKRVQEMSRLSIVGFASKRKEREVQALPEDFEHVMGVEHMRYFSPYLPTGSQKLYGVFKWESGSHKSVQ